MTDKLKHVPIEKRWAMDADAIPKMFKILKKGKFKSNFDFAGMKQVLRTQHDGPGPHESGSPQSVHGGGHGAGSSSASKASRVWTGEEHKGEPTLSKLEVGEIGEAIAERALEDHLGADFATLNEGINNSPIDLAGDHRAVEVKAGLATNGWRAQQWRATIGGMGKAEKALYSKMGKDEKRAWNARKKELILERKYNLLDQMSSEADAKIEPMTVGVILSPDGSRGDVYAVPGFHLRLGWNDYATDEYYLGTYNAN